MIEFSFKQTGSDVGLLLEALGTDGTDELAKLVLKGAQHAEGELRSTIYEMFPEGRTGALPRSFKATFIGRDQTVVTAAARSDLVYAAIQDRGGKIYPKTVKHLAVPVKRLPVGKWPRHYAKGFLTYIGFGGKTPMLVRIQRRKGQPDKIEPYFVLLRSVTIKGKGYIAIAADRAQPGIEEIMSDGLTRFVERVKNGVPEVSGG